MPDGLRLALTTLTVLPVRGPKQLDRRTAGRAMELAPLVGVGLGLASAAVAHAVRWLGAGDLLAAALAVTTLAVLTRGLHLDGLADLADGLSSYRDPEGTRAVMKDATTGPLGVAALVLVLLVQVAALQHVFHAHVGTVSLVLAVCVGRIAVTSACTQPAATDEGLGALVAGTVRRAVPVLWVGAALVAFGLWAAMDGDGAGTRTGRAATVGAAVVVSLAVARLLRGHAVRRVGGITGDVLGALVEVTTTVCLVVLAL